MMIRHRNINLYELIILKKSIIDKLESLIKNMNSPNKVIELLSYLNFDNINEPQEIDTKASNLGKQEKLLVDKIFILNDYNRDISHLFNRKR